MENLEKLDPDYQKDMDYQKIFASVDVSKSITTI